MSLTLMFYWCVVEERVAGCCSGMRLIFLLFYSVGLEILEDVPDFDVLLVCCEGGGLLAAVVECYLSVLYYSVGLEILEDVPDFDVLLVCCGGGGLLAAVASAVRLSGRQDCRIYGVEPQGGEYTTH